MEEIPISFQSVNHYMESFMYPLLEETRAELYSSLEAISAAPFSDMIAIEECKPHGQSLYDVRIENWKNKNCDHRKQPYRTLPGDIFIVTDTKPETASDLQRVGRMWAFARVTKLMGDEDEDNSSSVQFKLKTSEGFEGCPEMQKPLFMIYLINILSSERIWNALHMSGNLKIIKQVLGPDSVLKVSKEFHFWCSELYLKLLIDRCAWI